MRKKRDAEGTKATVLASAEQLFAEYGFHGTSLATVAEASGISDGLILYHFKSKEGLYQAVLNAVSKRYSAVLDSARDDSLPPAAMLRRALEAMFEFWRTDETYHRITLWSYLEGHTAPTTSEAQLTTGLATYMANLQAEGHFPADIDPVVFLSAIIGPVQFWLRYKANFTEILQLEGSREELDLRFLQQLIGMLERFFPPPPGEEA